MAVLTLVDEESRLLTLEPVDVEFESVLHSHVAAHRSIDESVLVLNVGLVGQSCLALVVDVGNLASSHFHKSLANLHTVDVHSH